MIKKKGRPSLQCTHCREQRKVKNSHSACVCGKKGNSSGSHVTSCGCHKTSTCICGTKSATDKLKRLLSPFLPRLSKLTLSSSSIVSRSKESTPSPIKSPAGSRLSSSGAMGSPQLSSTYSSSYPATNYGDSPWSTGNLDASLQYQLILDNQDRNNDSGPLEQSQSETNGIKPQNLGYENQTYLMEDPEFLEFFGVDSALLNNFPGQDSVSPVQPPVAPKLPVPTFPFYESHDSSPIPHRELILPYRLRHSHSGDGHRAGANGLLNGGHAHPLSPVQQRTERRLASRSSSISITSGHNELSRLPRPPSVISIGSVSSNRSNDHASASHYSSSQQNLPNITNSSAFPPTDYFSSGDLSSQEGDHKSYPLFSGPTALDILPYPSSNLNDPSLSNKWSIPDGVDSLIDEEPSSDHNDQALVAQSSRRVPINNQLLRSSSQMLYQQRQRMPGVASPHRENDLYKMFQDDPHLPTVNAESGSDTTKPLTDNGFGQTQLIADDDSYASLSMDAKLVDLEFFGLHNVFDSSPQELATI